jgi:drug/metabolite transporter (DMT)-like permease
MSILSQHHRPALVVALSASAWGLVWLPLRALDAAGLKAGWATLATFLVPALLMAPYVLHRARQGRMITRQDIATGLLTGGAVALYSNSILLTDVARALILFYVAPVWSTALEAVFLGRRLTLARMLALILGLAGLYTILANASGLPLPRNMGDAMALAAGLLWSIGSLRIRMTQEAEPAETLFAFFLAGSVAAALLALLDLPLAPSPATLHALFSWLLVAGAAYFIPVNIGILWGARHVDPGRLNILLQLEAVIGIASAALFAGEPFGLRELAGTALVTSAGLVDLLVTRPRLAAASSDEC